ncbi:hypothetical protein, partial [Streptomyces sp. NPDC058953]|uniref:hypothetical protein n=1 Tax=Streptomyces sp. NPDC058953 TaxID=3346676 RepID=UPI0036CEF0B1
AGIWHAPPRGGGGRGVAPGGKSFIPPAAAPPYTPPFEADAGHGTHWLIEGKSDALAKHAAEQAKRAAAEAWAREVTALEKYGTWRYLFATESDLAQASGWDALLTVTGARQDA